MAKSTPTPAYDLCANGRQALQQLRAFLANDPYDPRGAMELLADALDEIADYAEFDHGTGEDMLDASLHAEQRVAEHFAYTDVARLGGEGFAALRALVAAQLPVVEEDQALRAMPAHELHVARARVRVLSTWARAWERIWADIKSDPSWSAEQRAAWIHQANARGALSGPARPSRPAA